MDVPAEHKEYIDNGRYMSIDLGVDNLQPLLRIQVVAFIGKGQKYQIR